MKLVLPNLLVLFLVIVFFPVVIVAQTDARIIRLEKAHENEDDVYLKVLSVKVGDKDVPLNEPFTVNENWLKDLRIRVKNVSDKTISCAIVGFGVLEGINDRLEPQMSWGWAWSVSNGGCSKETTRKFDIKKGQEVELNSADTLVFHKKINSKISEISFHQAEFITATIFFRGERQKKGFPGHHSSMKIGPTVKYSAYRDE